MTEAGWEGFILVGLAGFGLGVGLVFATFVVRYLRRAEGWRLNGDDEPEE